jgi:pilus assembly protein CpaE
MSEIRLLLVDDNPQFVSSVKHMLSAEPDFKVVGTAASGRDAMDILQETSPDVTLVDIHLPDTHGFLLTEQIVKADPSIQPIIMSVAYDNETILNAMRAGAKNFIRKPPSEHVLTNAIREAYQKKQLLTPTQSNNNHDAEPEMNGKIIAVYSGRGGVGCTFLATNLALQLTSEETQSVLVDSDLQYGDIPVFLNMNAPYTIYEITELPDEFDMEGIESTLLSHSSGLKILASPQRPELADAITPDLMRRVLNILRSSYPFIVVDMPTDLNDVAVDVFESADLILMVLTPDIPSIRNLTSVMELMNKLGVHKEKIEIVLNMAERKESLANKHVLDAITLTPIAKLPYDDTRVLRSINLGEPLVLDKKTSALGKRLIQLGEQIKSKFSDEVDTL